MGLFTRRREQKQRERSLPNADAHRRAQALATSDPTLDYMIMYSVFSSGGTEQDAIDASREHGNPQSDIHDGGGGGY